MAAVIAPVRILIADDHPIFCAGLRKLLEAETGFMVVEYFTEERFVDEYRAAYRRLAADHQNDTTKQERSAVVTPFPARRPASARAGWNPRPAPR